MSIEGMQFGKSVERREDFRLIRGEGNYAADFKLDGMLHAAFVRSPHAHAKVLSVDTGAAAEMDGVVAVLTAAETKADGIADYLMAVAQKRPGDQPPAKTPREFLVSGIVRFAGEPIAMVVAETQEQARDAADQVLVEYEELPAVTTAPDALAEGAPAVWANAPDNIAFLWTKGDEAAIDAALKASHHVSTVDSIVTRVHAVPLEPRAALGFVADDGRITIHASHQSPFMLRQLMAKVFNVETDRIHVIAKDVGGSFGLKSGLTREDVLIPWAAKRLGRPVRWVSDRSEAFLADEHGRDCRMRTTLGLDKDGNFTALKVEYHINVGAYLSGRSLSHLMNIGGIAGVYRTPVIMGQAYGVLTTTQPTAAYRGAGRPDATYAIERVIDVAAQETGRDPFELRVQNLIPSSAMPYKTPFLYTYDCGDFAQAMEKAAELADYAGFEKRRQASAARGKLRGIGIANPIEVAAGPFNAVAKDFAKVVAHGDGTVDLHVGAMSTGQGLETALTEIVSQRLGVAPETIKYIQGDTDLLVNGKGSGGSASLSTGGGAISYSVDELIKAGKEIAAVQLESEPDKIDFVAGVFRRAGSNRTMSLSEVAKVVDDEGGLKGENAFQPQSPTYPNGCHICEVEVDPETGVVDVLGYYGVEDVGRVLNPMLMEGQIHGGVAQGLGQALKENILHDPSSGQLMTGSFMDYGMPIATDIPNISCDSVEVPTAMNPLGVKGVGEAGTVGSMAACMNAINHALAPLGVRHLDMPASPLRVWTAIQEASA